MSETLMNKIKGMFNRDYEDDYENEDLYDYVDVEEDEEQEEKGFFNKRNKVVNINQNQNVKMIIIKPTSFEQTEEICECLKQKRSIIVNLEYVNKDVARRIVDYMSGSVQALDGHIEKVSNSIFLFAPYNYEISNESTREELKNKLSVSWLKNG